MKYPSAADECFSVDVVDELVEDRLKMSLMKDPPEKALVFGANLENIDARKWIKYDKKLKNYLDTEVSLLQYSNR